MENKIPKGWEKLKLGDVVEHVKDKVPNRDEWTFDRYIGGEHFDEGEIRITKSAPIEGNEEVIGSAFHMRFKPGQVLYVTRNPRLRKGGMVDFEGVCSNVTFTLEAKEEKLSQRLLPFIIQTESFTKHACNSAHGSTNPFLNWKDIASYDLLLPPMSEQKKIAEVLWAIEENINSLENIIKINLLLKRRLSILGLTGRLNNNRNVSFNEVLGVELAEGWKVVNLGDVSFITDGAHFSPKETNNDKIIATVKDMQENGFNFKTCTTISNEDFEMLKRQGNSPQKGDVLFSKDGTIGRVFVYNQDREIILLSSIAIIRPNKNIDPNFIAEVLKSPLFWKQLNTLKSGTALGRIVLKSLKNLKLPLPNKLDEIDSILKVIEKINIERTKLNNNLNSLKALRQKLTNELLIGKLRL